MSKIRTIRVRWGAEAPPLPLGCRWCGHAPTPTRRTASRTAATICGSSPRPGRCAPGWPLGGGSACAVRCLRRCRCVHCGPARPPLPRSGRGLTRGWCRLPSPTAGSARPMSSPRSSASRTGGRSWRERGPGTARRARGRSCLPGACRAADHGRAPTLGADRCARGLRQSCVPDLDDLVGPWHLVRDRPVPGTGLRLLSDAPRS